MRSPNPTLVLGLAGLLLVGGACADPVTVRDGTTASEPPRIMDIVVYNHTGEGLELALVSDRAAVELGLMASRLEVSFEVDVRELGGAGVGTLVATGGGSWVMRSDPVWIEGGTALEFTVTAGGIVWKRGTPGIR